MVYAMDAEFELAANKVLHALNLNCGLLNILLEESDVFKASLDVLGVDIFFLEPWDPGLLFNHKLCRISGLFHTQEPCKPMRKIPSLSYEVVYGIFVFQVTKCDFLHELLNKDVVSKANFDKFYMDTLSLDLPWDPGLLTNHILLDMYGFLYDQRPFRRWCYSSSDSPAPMRKSPSLSSEVVYGNFVFQLNNLSFEDFVEEFFIRSEFCPIFALCGSLFPLQIEALSLWLVPWIGCACFGWIWYRDGFDLMYAETCSQPI